MSHRVSAAENVGSLNIHYEVPSGKAQPLSQKLRHLLEYNVNNKTLIIIGVLLCLCIAVITPTVYRSFHVVPYNRVAFIRNVYGSVDTSTVLTQGRYFLPLTKDVVTFDSTVTLVKFKQTE